MNLRFFFIDNARFSQRVHITNNLYSFPTNLKEKYQELLSRDLTEAELSVAKEIVRQYREKRLKPYLYDYYTKVYHFSGIIKILSKIKKYILGKQYRIQSILDVIRFSTYVRNTRFKITKFIFKTNCLFKTYQPDYSDKYFYFPLHHQPEATIDLMGAFYSDQNIVVDAVSKSLPAGYYLYVKDHPSMFGLRPLRYYRDLMKFPRVKLIDTYADSYELTEHSAGVVAITGTAGWEAFILGKPFIVFGQIFYNCAGGNVHFVQSVYDLPSILKKAVESPHSDDEKILKFCLAYYKTTYPGIIYVPKLMPSMLSDETIGQLTDAIVKAYSEL